LLKLKEKIDGEQPERKKKKINRKKEKGSF